jgi:hypothetical protein
VLLGLQEQGRRLTRVSLQVINHDLRALEQRGEVGRVPQDLDQEALDAGAAYLQAVNRVTDDGLRDHLREFYTLAVNASTLNDLTPAQAKAKLESSRTELAFVYQQAHDALGDVLRNELRREE